LTTAEDVYDKPESKGKDKTIKGTVKYKPKVKDVDDAHGQSRWKYHLLID
jgi:hypothetical protein